MSKEAYAAKLAQSRLGSASFGLVEACCACIVAFVLEQSLFGEYDVDVAQTGAFAACAIGAFAWLRRRKAARQLPAKAVRRGPARGARAPRREVDPEVVEGILAACRAGDLALADERLSSALGPFKGRAGSGTAACAGAASGRAPEAGGHGSSLPWDGQARVLVEACLEVGAPKLAAAWLERLHEAGLKPGVRRVLNVLTALTDEDLTDEAKDEAKEFFLRALAAGAPADTACYHAFFERCVPPGDAEAVEALLRRPLARSPGEQESVFMALLRSRAQTRDRQQAEGWMARGVAMGVPARRLYSSMVQTSSRLGQTEQAEHWLEKLEEAVQSDDAQRGKSSSELRAALDCAVYNAVMDSCIKGGETKRAEAWFEKMVASGIVPDAVSVSTMMKAYTRGGSLAGAERWLRLARERRVRLDVFPYSVVIDAAARVPNPERAEWWLRETIRDGLEPDVVSYNVVISAWAKKGSAPGAQRVVALMTGRGVEPDVVTLSASVDACAKKGDLAQAEAILEQIVSRGKTQPDAITYNALINAAVQGGDVARAEEWLAAMAQNGVARSVVSYTTLLHSHARAGHIENAERVLERMAADGIEANVVSYSALIQACSRAGDVERAERWFQHMLAAGIRANVTTFGALLNVCAKARDYKRAEKWLDAMNEHGVAPNVICYTTVIDACAKAGLAERAEMWLRHVTTFPARAAPLARSEELVPTNQCFTCTANAYAVQGEYSEVERLFEEMEERGIQMSEYSLTVLLSAYMHARPWQTERAAAAFRRHTERGLPVTTAPCKVLRAVVGNQRYHELLAECPRGSLPFDVRA